MYWMLFPHRGIANSWRHHLSVAVPWTLSFLPARIASAAAALLEGGHEIMSVSDRSNRPSSLTVGHVHETMIVLLFVLVIMTVPIHARIDYPHDYPHVHARDYLHVHARAHGPVV